MVQSWVVGKCRSCRGAAPLNFIIRGRSLTRRAKSSDSRTIAVAGLMLLATLGLIITFAQVLADFVLPITPVPLRVWAVLAVSFAIVGGAATLARDRSLLWQIPLRSFALGALAVGVKFLVHAGFYDRHWLASAGAIICVIYLVLAAGAAWLMRHLQKRLLGRRQAA